MNEKIKKLSAAISLAKEKIIKEQQFIKSAEAKIKELERAELIGDVNLLAAKGIDIKDIIAAIKRNDTEALKKYLLPNNIAADGDG